MIYKITKTKNLKRLASNIPQNRDKAISDLRPIHALDTETWLGDIFLLADNDGDFIDTFKEGITIDTVIQFLTRSKYENSWNFFWNLNYDASVILKLLGKDILATYRKKRAFRFTYKKYKFYFIPKKTLRISKGKHSWIFFDIIQFYDFKPLDVAYGENIRKPLDEQYLKTKSKRDQFPPTYYRDNRKQVRNYCITDCRLTKELCKHWIKLFHQAFGFYPQRWISSGYLAEKVLINHGIVIPFFKELNFKLQDFAYCSYFGGRFEMVQRGYIGQAYLYDINSAYPDALANMPDITKGIWKHGLTKIDEKALIGFFKILAKVPDSEYLPCFPFRRITRSNDVLIFPSGVFVTYCTLDEIKNAEPEQFEILDSWQYFDESPEYPLRDFIHKFFDQRMKLKHEGNPLQLPIKIILNSIYGKLGQKITRKIGNLFNPVIFAYITGYTRAKMYRFILDHDIKKDLVSFATDSILVTREIKTDSKKLGEFGFDGSGDDVFQLQNGIGRMNGKWKLRGLGKLGKKEVEHVATKEKDGRLYIEYMVKRTKQLASAIIQGKINDIGKIKIETREVNLNADKKRQWLGTLQSINDKKMNVSIPLSLNHLLKSQV